MFDPTTRLQSARMHSADLHHAARHSTPHAADHALHRATTTPAARRSAPRGIAASTGRLSSLLALVRAHRPVAGGPAPVAGPGCGVALDHQST